MRIVATDTAQLSAAHRILATADGVEAMWKIFVTSLADRIGPCHQQVVDAAVVRHVTGCTLVRHASGMLAGSKAGNLILVTGPAELRGSFGQQMHLGAGMRHVTGLAFACLVGWMLDRPRIELVAVGALGADSRQLGRFVAVELRMAVLALAFLDRHVLAGAGNHILVAGRASDGDVAPGQLGLVWAVAGTASRKLVRLVRGEGAFGIELVGVATATDLVFGLDQKLGLVAAVAVVAEQAFAFGHARMGLVDLLAMVLVALVAGLGLVGRLYGIIRILVEAGMAVAAATLHVGLVRMLEAGGVRQLVVTGHTHLATDLRQLCRSVVGIVTAAALDLLSVSMAWGADVGIDLVLVAGAAQLSLRKAHHRRLVRSMRQMAQVAFALGHAGMRLIDDLTMVLMAAVAQLRRRLHQQVRVRSGMGKVAIQTLTLGKGLVRVLHRRVGIRHLLPVALAAYLVHRAPQLGRVRSLEIVACPTGAIPKRFVHIVQACHRRRSQTSFGGTGGRRWRHKGSRCRRRLWRRRAPSTTAQKEHREKDEYGYDDNLAPAR